MASRRSLPVALALLALAALSPAASRGGGLDAPAVELPGIGVAHADRRYRVRAGDTLARIARRFHISIAELRRANRLRGDSLQIGQALRIPGARESRRIARRAGYHVVRRGDSLGRIARRHGVTIAALRRANRVRGDRIRVGQRLRIPGRRRENRAPRLPPRPRRPDQEAVAGTASGLGLGPVSVARRLLTGSPEPSWLEYAATAPRAIPEHAYGVGTSIDGSELVSSQVDSAMAAERAELHDEPDLGDENEHDDEGELDDEDPMAVDGDEDHRDAVAVDADDDETEPAPVPQGDVLPYDAAHDAGPGDGPGTLQSPLADARFLRGWGSGVNGYHLALDLYAPPNTPVLASERGVVVYAGSEMRGYGRAVLVLHPSGLVTTYAHNNELLVVPGELVARGQIISLLGNTGISRGPHVHYMLVKDGAHCDALPLIRPTPRRRGHPDFRVTRQRWVDGEEAPVRCARREDRPHPSEARRQRVRERRRRARRRRSAMGGMARMRGSVME